MLVGFSNRVWAGQLAIPSFIGIYPENGFALICGRGKKEENMNVHALESEYGIFICPRQTCATLRRACENAARKLNCWFAQMRERYCLAEMVCRHSRQICATGRLHWQTEVSLMLEVGGERPQQGEANLILEVVRERHVRVVPEGVRPKHRDR